MFPSHDMNPIAVAQMRRERLAADIAAVDGRRSLRLRLGGAAIALLLALAIAI